MNLGQIDHRTLLADGVLSDELRDSIVAWWAERLPDLVAIGADTKLTIPPEPPAKAVDLPDQTFEME